MNDDIEPILDFGKLKTYLKSIGLQIDEVSSDGYRPVKPGDVTLQALKNGTYTFESDGIYLNGKQGEHQKVFLYKRKYHLLQFGKPRMHVRKCKTIEDFIKSGSFEVEYRHANTEEVPVINTDEDNVDGLVDHLPLCKNCLDMLIKEGKSRIKDSNEYVDLLKQTMGLDESLDQEVDVDIFGNTKNWQKISRAFREAHDWTCERCGLHIDNPWDYQFMHVHHRNGIKTDNRKANLECLCIRCHSQVDAVHRENFSVGDKKEMLEDFNRKYPPAEADGKSPSAMADDLPF